jgi:hypothetical protein
MLRLQRTCKITLSSKVLMLNYYKPLVTNILYMLILFDA